METLNPVGSFLGDNRVTSPLSRETSFNRAIPAVQTITQEILGKVNNPHILIVGVGLDAGVVQCPYVPYRLASIFEQKQEPFQLTLVDCDPDIRWDIRDREHIFLPDQYYKTPSVQSEWDDYMQATNQQERIIHHRVPGLRFEYDDGDYDEDDLYSDQLRVGVRMASIPENFRRMRESGTLNVLIQDVAEVNLQPGSIDYIDSMNVFYMLDKQRQQEALARLSRGLKRGGLIGLNDLQRGPLFRNIGGWMDPSSLSDFGLEVITFDLSTEYTESQDSADPNTVTALLRKR